MEYFIYHSLAGGPQLLRSDGVWISQVDGNPAYQEYQAWLAEGNEPGEWVPEVSE
jgi:hypothetical protein